NATPHRGADCYETRFDELTAVKVCHGTPRVNKIQLGHSPSPNRLGPLVGGLQQFSKREFKAGQQGSPIDVSLIYGALDWLPVARQVHRQRSLKSIDDPILGDSSFEIFITFLNIIAPPRRFAARNEFNDNCRNVPVRVRPTTGVRDPDYAVSAAAVASCSKIMFKHRLDQAVSRGVLFAIRA